jgi:NTP pyrophosphatase (non-canonical NTP hydrolase)
VSVFSDVMEFMRIGHPDKIAARPSTPNADTRALCKGLIKEEYDELFEAFLDNDVVEAADAMADLIYVIVFTAHCYGIPLARVWAEVQRTNMAKFPDGKVLRRESDGKIMKPEGWEPPDIRKILEEASGQG